jgi:hypothetical protein
LKLICKRKSCGQNDVVISWQPYSLGLRITKMWYCQAPSNQIRFMKALLIHFGRRRGFYTILKNLPVTPAPADAFFLPPSIRRQMLDEKSPQTSAEGSPETSVAVASGHERFEVIGSALFASPSHTRGGCLRSKTAGSAIPALKNAGRR